MATSIKNKLKFLSNGKSAYEIAVLEGFVGTEAEWLTSLIGAPGTNGAAGKSIISTLNYPSTSLGLQNEYAWDKNSKILYGPKLNNINWGTYTPTMISSASGGSSGTGNQGSTSSISSYEMQLSWGTSSISSTSLRKIKLGSEFSQSYLAGISGSPHTRRTIGARITATSGGVVGYRIWLDNTSATGLSTNDRLLFSRYIDLPTHGSSTIFYGNYSHGTFPAGSIFIGEKALTGVGSNNEYIDTLDVNAERKSLHNIPYSVNEEFLVSVDFSNGNTYITLPDNTQFGPILIPALTTNSWGISVEIIKKDTTIAGSINIETQPLGNSLVPPQGFEHGWIENEPNLVRLNNDNKRIKKHLSVINKVDANTNYDAYNFNNDSWLITGDEYGEKLGAGYTLAAVTYGNPNLNGKQITISNLTTSNSTLVACHDNIKNNAIPLNRNRTTFLGLGFNRSSYASTNALRNGVGIGLYLTKDGVQWQEYIFYVKAPASLTPGDYYRVYDQYNSFDVQSTKQFNSIDTDQFSFDLRISPEGIISTTLYNDSLLDLVGDGYCTVNDLRYVKYIPFIVFKDNEVGYSGSSNVWFYEKPKEFSSAVYYGDFNNLAAIQDELAGMVTIAGDLIPEYSQFSTVTPTDLTIYNRITFDEASVIGSNIFCEYPGYYVSTDKSTTFLVKDGDILLSKNGKAEKITKTKNELLEQIPLSAPNTIDGLMSATQAQQLDSLNTYALTTTDVNQADGVAGLNPIGEIADAQLQPFNKNIIDWDLAANTIESNVYINTATIQNGSVDSWNDYFNTTASVTFTASGMTGATGQKRVAIGFANGLTDPTGVRRIEVTPPAAYNSADLNKVWYVIGYVDEDTSMTTLTEAIVGDIAGTGPTLPITGTAVAVSQTSSSSTNGVRVGYTTWKNWSSGGGTRSNVLLTNSTRTSGTQSGGSYVIGFLPRLSGAGNSMLRTRTGGAYSETAISVAQDVDLTPGKKFRLFVAMVYDDERLVTQTQSFAFSIGAGNYNILGSSVYTGSKPFTYANQNARLPSIDSGSIALRKFRWLRASTAGYFNNVSININDIMLVMNDMSNIDFLKVNQNATLLKFTGAILTG